ncbi:MAG: hypothetical protein ACI4M6_05680 [Christensenellaceae bacterium]
MFYRQEKEKRRIAVSYGVLFSIKYTITRATYKTETKSYIFANVACSIVDGSINISYLVKQQDFTTAPLILKSNSRLNSAFSLHLLVASSTLVGITRIAQRLSVPFEVLIVYLFPERYADGR